MLLKCVYPFTSSEGGRGGEDKNYATLINLRLMFWACHINKMYFRSNQFCYVDFDNLIPQISKKIREDFISLNRGN